MIREINELILLLDKNETGFTLYRVFGKSGTVDIADRKKDQTNKDIENEVERKMLGKAIQKLSERERIIVDLRYGLSSIDGEEKTQKEVADMLGISQSYISRLEKKIIKRLKKEMIKAI